MKFSLFLNNRAQKTLVILLIAVGSGNTQAGNLVLNPNFDTSLADWVTTPAGVSMLFTSDGSRSAPSAALDVVESISTFSDLSQCIVTPTLPASVDLSARRKVPDPTQGGASVIDAEFYSSTDCHGLLIQQFANTTRDLGDGWTEYSHLNIAPPPGTQSVKIDLHATGLPPNGGVTLFDDVFFGESGTMPVRLQEFSVD